MRPEVLLNLEARPHEMATLRKPRWAAHQVIAAAEARRGDLDSEARLLRAAWHLGSRHACRDRKTRSISPRPWLIEMLRGLGLSTKVVMQPLPAQARRL